MPGDARKTIKRFGPAYLGLFTVISTMSFLGLALRAPDDRADYSWLWLLCPLAPAALVALWLGLSAATHLARTLVPVWLGLQGRDARISALVAEQTSLQDELALVPSQLSAAYSEGVVEGLRRLHGVQAAKRVSSTPTKPTAIGGPELRVVAGCKRRTVIPKGARFTLADIADDQPLGVLEVTNVTPEGDVVFVCVDRVRVDYWDSLSSLTSSESRILVGTHLIAYSPFAHHTTNTPIPFAVSDSGITPEQETA